MVARRKTAAPAKQPGTKQAKAQPTTTTKRESKSLTPKRLLSERLERASHANVKTLALLERLDCDAETVGKIERKLHAADTAVHEVFDLVQALPAFTAFRYLSRGAGAAANALRPGVLVNIKQEQVELYKQAMGKIVGRSLTVVSARGGKVLCQAQDGAHLMVPVKELEAVAPKAKRSRAKVAGPVVVPSGVVMPNAKPKARRRARRATKVGTVPTTLGAVTPNGHDAPSASPTVAA